MDNIIWVGVDPSNSIKESNEANNIAKKNIFVEASNLLHILQAKTDKKVYFEGEEVLISCVVQNATYNTSANVSADIENPEGIVDRLILMEGLIGNYNGTFTNTSLSGTYNLTIHANRTGFIDNNESLSFEILDTTPPSSITNITSKNGSTWINWTWDNPSNKDFYHTLIYLNGTWKTATSNNYYNATGLNISTEYTLRTHTVDKSGNINSTWVNDTAASNFALAEISIQGITTIVTPIKDTVNPGENATYKVSINCISGPENVSLKIDDPEEGWTYHFEPEVLDLEDGETGYSILNITVPSDAIPGVYSNTVNVTTYLFSIIAGYSTYTIYVTTPIPEFNTIVVPIALVLSIMLLMYHLKRKSKL